MHQGFHLNPRCVFGKTKIPSALLQQTNKNRIQKWYTIYKDHITLDDYEVKDGSNLELYYN